jgi:hypothetical protein
MGWTHKITGDTLRVVGNSVMDQFELSLKNVSRA